MVGKMAGQQSFCGFQLHSVLMFGKGCPGVLGYQQTKRDGWQADPCMRLAYVLSAFRDKLLVAWSHERLLAAPAAFPSDGKQPGVKMCRYKHWCDLSHEQGKAAWLPHVKLFIIIPVHSHKKLMRFRWAAGPLPQIVDGVPREERICPVCHHSGAVEDEKHVLLHCTAYENLFFLVWFFTGDPFRSGCRTTPTTPRGQRDSPPKA